MVMLLRGLAVMHGHVSQLLGRSGDLCLHSVVEEFSSRALLRAIAVKGIGNLC